MSKEVGIVGEIALTQFYGGTRGTCIQFTPCGPHSDYAQLDMAEVVKLRNKLTAILREHRNVDT